MGLLTGEDVTNLSSEPLYQTYRATVITKEIRRQTVCRNISKTSVDFPVDWRTRAGTGNGTARGSPVPPPGQTTLWQDLPAVRDSGVLGQLTPEECKYQEVGVRRERIKCCVRFTKREINKGCEMLYQVFHHILK